MKWMLVMHRTDDALIVKFSRTKDFAWKFTITEAGTFDDVCLYEYVPGSHVWKPHTRWGHMCADGKWDVMYCDDAARAAARKAHHD